jgi:hypothetical protein
MPKKRTSPGKTGEAVLREYNHRCSICGADRPQLHHIDEDPSNQDPLNLLPLCPNHHLTDQHNPTARVDPRLLRLFRIYKDPTILAPQFVPLFQRLTYLEDVGSSSMDVLLHKGNELIAFVSQLQMGTFYAEKIRERLIAPPSPGAVWLPESAEHQRKREDRQRQQLVDYRRQVEISRDDVLQLAIESLRYQHWRRGKAQSEGT